MGGSFAEHLLADQQTLTTMGTENPAATRLTVDAFLTEVGVGPFQKQLLCVCCLAIAGDAMEKASLMYVLRAAAQAWHVDASQLGYLGSVSAFGQALGYGTGGYLCDSIGRRNSLLCAVSMTFMLGSICAIVPGFWPFLIGRFLLNIALGACMPVAFTLVSDYAPPIQRTRWTSFLYASYGLGRLLSSAIASVLLERSWRSYMFVICLPSAFVLLLNAGIPESPQFLLAVGRRHDANTILIKVAQANGAAGLSARLVEGAHIVCDSGHAEEEVGTVGPRLQHATFLLFCAMWALLSFGTQWFDWVLKILLESGVSSKTTYAGLVVFNSNELVVPLLIAIVSKEFLLKHDRLATALACIVASFSIIAFAATISVGPMVVGPLVCLTSAICASYATISVWVLHYILTPAYFPAGRRGTALGFFLFVNRIAGTVGPMLASGLVENHKAMVPYLSGGCFLGLACLVPCLGEPLAGSDEYECRAPTRLTGTSTDPEDQGDVSPSRDTFTRGNVDNLAGGAEP